MMDSIPPKKFPGPKRPNYKLTTPVKPELSQIISKKKAEVSSKVTSKLLVTVYLTLPREDRGFKDVDPDDADVKTLLSRLVSEHQVEIEADIDEDLESPVITVRASNREKAKEVVMELRKHLLKVAGEETTWLTRTMIYPSKVGKGAFTAVLEQKERVGARAAAARPSSLQVVINQLQVKADEADYAKQLEGTLGVLFKTLKSQSYAMRMRFDFGKYFLRQWKKDQLIYSFSELQSLVSRNAGRGIGHMKNTVGEKAIRGVWELFANKADTLPQGVRDWASNWTTKYSLILHTKHHRIETNLEAVSSQRNTVNRNKAQEYNAGPLSCQEHAKQPQAAEVITLCPENAYDWRLEVRKLPPAKYVSCPFTMAELQKSLNFKPKTNDFDFPNLSMSRDFMKKHDVQKVYGKVTRQFQLSMRYCLEVSLTHVREQGPANSMVPIVTGGEVILSDNVEWDRSMAETSQVPRAWKGSFAEEFLDDYEDAPEATGTDGVSKLLAWIRWIQRILDKAEE